MIFEITIFRRRPSYGNAYTIRIVFNDGRASMIHTDCGDVSDALAVPEVVAALALVESGGDPGPGLSVSQWAAAGMPGLPSSQIPAEPSPQLRSLGAASEMARCAAKRAHELRRAADLLDEVVQTWDGSIQAALEIAGTPK